MKDNRQTKQYHQVKDGCFYAGFALDAAFLTVFLCTGLSVQLRDFAAAVSYSPWVVNAVYISIFATVFYLLHFPLRFFEGHYWEDCHGLTTQSPAGWLLDDFKKGALGLVLMLVMIEVVYFLLSAFPRIWWLLAGVFWLFMSVFLARILPEFIIPLFYKYSPLKDEELKDRIRRLFDRCQVKLQDVCAIDFSAKTKKANAFVCGLGKSRKVVLSDTLLDQFSHNEIETVVAHELGHHKGGDILKLLAVNTVLVFIAFYGLDVGLRRALGWFGLNRLDDIAFFPMVVLGLMIFGLVTTPLTNAFSRRLEVKADLFSLRLTGNTAAFISMIRKLGEMNLAEFEPSRFNEMMFYDHPPIAKRIRLAEHFSTQD